MKTQVRNTTLVLGTLGVLASTLGGASFHQAEAQSKNTWKNLAIAGGVATAYGLAKKKNKVAIVGGVGTAYAYSRYNSARKKEKQAAENRRIRWYQARYGRHWRTYYKPGV